MDTRKVLILSTAFALLGSLPALGDTFVTYPTPTAPYTTLTHNYGGGNGSGGSISSLGPFSFSNSLTEYSVPGTWATWGSPPNTESSTPNVLFNTSTSLTITLGGSASTAGFELEPDAFGVDDVSASFYDGATLIDTLTIPVNGDAGAMLFALTDTTPGASITSIVINDGTGFAIAELRAGGVPEPSSLALLGTGLLGTVGLLRRRFS